MLNRLNPRVAVEASLHQESSKPDKEATASVVEINSNEEGAWAAEEELVVAGKDWFEEVVAEEMVKLTEVEGKRTELFGDMSGKAFIVAESVQVSARAKLYDSGCTNHISPYESSFDNFLIIETRHFQAANKQTFSTIGKGNLVIDVPNKNGITKFWLQDILYLPEVAYTLVSVRCLDKDGFLVTFGGGRCTIRDVNKEVIGVVPKTVTRVYKVEHEDIASGEEEHLTLDTLHHCLGHISLETVRKLVKERMITGVWLKYTPYGRTFFCTLCVYAKETWKPVPKMREGVRVDVFGGEVHSDVWGPALVESKGGKQYYITFINEKSCLTTLYLLRMKDKVPGAYKLYEAWVETQMGMKLKILNLDQGGEYQGTEFVEYLKSKGTIQRLNVHDMPQHAGVAKHRNQTIGEQFRALLHASSLPKFLWEEAACHIVWLLNRTTTKAVEGMTPFEATFGKKPDLKNVCEWGEKFYVRIEGGMKLGGRVREGWWLGIDNESKGVRVYWPDTKSVTVERNIYYDNTSGSRNDEESEAIGLTRNIVTTTQPVPVVQIPVNHDKSAQESKADAPSK